MSKTETAYTKTGIFITFSGNCREAFAAYQACFGGELFVKLFEQPIEGFADSPVIRATLQSEKLVLHGSDLVHNEGKRVGNNMAVLVNCTGNDERLVYLQQLQNSKDTSLSIDEDQPMIEITDRFDVRWIFSLL